MQTGRKDLSKREKVMLLIMLVAGFTAIMVMIIIIPFYERLQDGLGYYGNLVNERAQVEAMLAAEPAIRESHVAAAQEYDEIRERFLSESHISEIGRMLTRLNEEHGLMPIEQRLSRPVEFGGGDVFLVVSASKTVRGLYTSLTRLLDTVEQTDYLRVSQVNFSVGDGNMLDRISINFEVAMMRDWAEDGTQ